MNPIQDVLSGPAWLMAQGVDNRIFLDRPGWNTLDRQNLTGLPGSGGNAPLLQSVGPGILVPYRESGPRVQPRPAGDPRFQQQPITDGTGYRRQPT